MELDREQKRKLYRAGRYSFPVPPVHHSLWTEDNWIDYIDRYGKWWPMPVVTGKEGPTNDH